MKGLFSTIFNKTTRPEVIFGSSVEIETGEGEKKILIVPVGSFQNHHSGPHEITAEDIKAMEKNLKSSGTDILFDYGHDSLWNPLAEAAGWSPSESAEAREKGLYIEYPKFTPAAEEKTARREYRYFSPVYRFGGKDKKGESPGAELLSVALTNTPYFDREIDHISNSYHSLIKEVGMTKTIFHFLGLEPGDTIEAAEKRIAEIRKECGLDDSDDIDTLLNSIGEAPEEIERDLAAELDEINKRIGELEKTAAAGPVTAETLVENAVNEGKILPAEKEPWLAFAKTDPERAAEILNSREKNSALPGKIQLPGEKLNSVTRSEAADFIKNLGRGK